MHGQWIGRIEGNPAGLTVVDLDNESNHFRGTAFLFPDDLTIPVTGAEIETTNKDDRQNLSAKTYPVSRQGFRITPEQMNQLHPGIAHPEQADISFELVGGKLRVTFSTSIGTTGSGVLNPSQSDEPSALIPLATVSTWDSFKSHVSQLKPYDMMFRGQPCQNRLRTSFHRTRRSDLVRFINEDINLLHRQLTPTSQRFFDIADGRQLGAFYSLIQHHGYPTPLLDWSHSPYIAAFFAFRPKIGPNDKVRIFIFNRVEWMRRFTQLQILIYAYPHFSVLELLGIENNRMIPQQALSSVTNVDDIESYIAFQEAATSTKYLEVIELSGEERSIVLNDLGMMGITAASLFPGFDGTCEAVKGRLFGY